MKVAVITFTWNEEQIIPYFLKHYENLADKIFVLDNESNDSTRDILNAHPKVEISSQYGTGGIFDHDVFMYLKNNFWKSLKGEFDWVIIVDADEFLHHPTIDMRVLLEGYLQQNISHVPTIGFNMTHHEYPKFSNIPIIDIVKTGIENALYGKTVAFNLHLITEINYWIGAHVCEPQGENLNAPTSTAYLLHYRYFGFDHWKQRNDAYTARVGEIHGAGAYPIWQEKIQTEQDYNHEFNIVLAKKILD